MWDLVTGSTCPTVSTLMCFRYLKFNVFKNKFKFLAPQIYSSSHVPNLGHSISNRPFAKWGTLESVLITPSLSPPRVGMFLATSICEHISYIWEILHTSYSGSQGLPFPVSLAVRVQAFDPVRTPSFIVQVRGRGVQFEVSSGGGSGIPCSASIRSHLWCDMECPVVLTVDFSLYGL